MITNIFS